MRTITGLFGGLLANLFVWGWIVIFINGPAIEYRFSQFIDQTFLAIFIVSATTAFIGIYLGNRYFDKKK